MSHWHYTMLEYTFVRHTPAVTSALQNRSLSEPQTNPKLWPQIFTLHVNTQSLAKPSYFYIISRNSGVPFSTASGQPGLRTKSKHVSFNYLFLLYFSSASIYSLLYLSIYGLSETDKFSQGTIKNLPLSFTHVQELRLLTQFPY